MPLACPVNSGFPSLHPPRLPHPLLTAPATRGSSGRGSALPFSFKTAAQEPISTYVLCQTDTLDQIVERFQKREGLCLSQPEPRRYGPFVRSSRHANAPS